MQSISRLLITLALVVASGLIAYKAINISHSNDEGTQSKLNSLPLFAARYTDLLGHEKALKQWKGKPILVNFWATWCPPCREEMPELSKIQDEFKNQGLIVLGISTDDLEKTKNFIDKSPVSYTIVVGDMNGLDLSQMLDNNQGILPYSVLIDHNGKVAKIFQGRIDPETVEQAIQATLKP